MARERQSEAVDQTVTDPSEITKPSPFQQMLREMALTATMEAEENTFSGDDVTGILTAETEDDIWDADDRGPLNFQHLAGCDLIIMDFSVKFSRGNNADIKTPFIVTNDRNESRKMYMLVKCVRATNEQSNQMIKLPEPGEVFEANTSARFVASKIWAFYKKGRIQPNAGRTLTCFVESTDLGGGQAVIKLKRPRNQSVTSSVA